MFGQDYIYLKDVSKVNKGIRQRQVRLQFFWIRIYVFRVCSGLIFRVDFQGNVYFLFILKLYGIFGIENFFIKQVLGLEMDVLYIS